MKFQHFNVHTLLHKHTLTLIWVINFMWIGGFYEVAQLHEC